MTTTNCLGIFMDHEHAHFIEFTTDPIETKTLDSKFTNEVKEESIHNGEKLMHQKERHEESEYYKQIGAVIKHYTNVILFGPTEAKTELFNVLRANHLFDKIRIEVKPADKMTDNQQHAFVTKHFHEINFKGVASGL